MTTHEDPTLTDSTEELQAPVSEGSRTAEHGESTAVAPEAAPAPDAATPDAGAAEAAEPSAKHEPSADEMLFADDDLAELRTRWTGVQAAFVDDPQACVQKADDLLSDLVEQLTTRFAEARTRLEEQWSRGQEASTEDLRLALMRYRQFFERLLVV